MRVLVTFAVEAEFAPWRKLRNFRKTTIGAGPKSISGFEARVEEHCVAVFLTGMGQKACEESLARLELSVSEKPGFILSSGLAGALREGLNPGDVVVPQRIRTLNNDADATADSELVDFAVRGGATLIETLITSKQLVQTAAEKRRLGFFGEGVDMESAFIMSKGAELHCRTITIRAISDSVGEDLPIDFDRCVTAQGSPRPMNLVNAIVERPSRLPKLIRFGKQSNEAAHKLIRFLDSFVGALPRVEAVAG